MARKASRASGLKAFMNFISPSRFRTLPVIFSRYQGDQCAAGHLGESLPSAKISEESYGGLMREIRTIGIVNGGGAPPGVNPVIRAIVRSAINEHRMRVVGILNGFDGLIWPEGAKEMTEESVSGILPRGGTILGTTNRGHPFCYKATE